MTIDRMKEGYSQIRNKALANAFSYMHLIEGWGTGIPRLLQDMKDYGLAEPEFIDMEIALRINLYRANTGREAGEETIEEIKTNGETSGESSEETKTSGETSGKTSGETKTSEKTTVEKVVEEIKNDPSITQKQLADRLGLSYAGIRYVMKKLQEEGILERTGSTKKGRWIIKQ